MKSFLFIGVFIMGLLPNCFSQETTNWEAWKWLSGDWVGEGSGVPGQGGGTFSFQTELDGKIMVRHSHSEYPSEAGKPSIVHNDLMVIYPENNGTRASYFDNEGHVIQYMVSYSTKTIVFLSEKKGPLPVFRLTYTLLEDGRVNTAFEVSQDGVNFRMYVEGKSKKRN